MQKKQANPRIRKQLVRNVEKANTKAHAQREFVVDPLIYLNSGDGNDTEENIASNVMTLAMKEASKVTKDTSENIGTMVIRKTSKKLNFAFAEAIYQGLIPLNDVKATTPSVTSKRIARPPRKLDSPPEPVINPYVPKHEYLFLCYDMKGKEFGFRSDKKKIFGQPEYIKTFKDPKDYVGKDRKVIKNPLLNTVAFDEDSSGLRKFRQLHVSLGMGCPKLQSYFDGCGLHRKSQAWKI